ncbi:DUF1127 domain-containing protein [Vibrio marisflavi]|uniref:DUF1127 domain-containing protein n=1 Tax=Vibrio marisflavi CECT 7928 TaxID=634439 RepID=A0ABM9A740_9VIBR|nr:DUF1127 domain-containing protein [Vibrio marisflavi]CAH0541147.1 hypothetical protein VMF7928_03408 [Vibrio marisflavi CECT 7928]
MRHSIYLKLAVLLVKADLRREEREYKKAIRREAYFIPYQNQHLLKDIGLDKEGRANTISMPIQAKAKRTVNLLRQSVEARPIT